MKMLFKSKYVIIFSIIFLLIIAIVAGGPLFMEGENIIKLSVTLWFLDDTSREVLRIANDNHRFLLYANNKEELIEEYLNKNRPFNVRTQWEFDKTEENAIIMIETREDESNRVEIPYKKFKENYVIATFPNR